jgi:hypothetical protein
MYIQRHSEGNQFQSKVKHVFQIQTGTALKKRMCNKKLLYTIFHILLFLQYIE